MFEKQRIVKVIIVLISCIFILNGCGKTENINETDTVKNDVFLAEEQESEKDTEKIVLKIASTLTPDMVSIKALENMAKNVEEKTDGRIEILIYPSSQLGDQNEYLRGVQMGTIEMCLISPTPLTEYDPHFVVLGCPGFFESSEEMAAFYETDEIKEIFDNFRRENGIRYLGFYHEGIRDVWLTKKKIEKIEEFSGVKLRVPDVPLSVKKFEALGMEAIPMSLSEVYTGMQTGVVEGIENNVEIITGNNLHELIKYRVKTNHTYSSLILIANENAINALDEELQKVLFECIEESTEEAYESFKTGQEEAYRIVEEAGIETIELNDEEKEKMNDIWRQVSEESLEGLFPDSIYDVVASCKQ